MKHRWIAGLLLIVAVALAACTPAQGGTGAEESTPVPADFYNDY